MRRYAIRSYTKYTILQEHVAVVEDILGKKLPPGAVVHHVNGDPFDNKPENLVVCPNQAYHKLLHMREDALDACGNANYRRCVYCKQYDDPANMAIHSQRANKGYIHVACRRSKDAKYRAAG